MSTRAATTLCAALACAVATGCGGGANAARPHVRVVVTAPTDGSTVAVHAIEVIGRVSPRAASVSVGGKRAIVAGGRFRLPVVLARPVTRIAIVARARGYETWAKSITVHYARPPRARASAPASTQTVATAQPYTGVLAPADRICAARNRKVLALPTLTPYNVGAHDSAMLAINFGAVAQLRTLERSSATRALLGPFVDYLATAEAKNARAEELMKAGESKKASRLTQTRFNRGMQLADAPTGHAMPDCGRAMLLSVGSGRE